MTVVAVTGGAGFLGQALVRSLVQLETVELVLALDTALALDREMFEDSPKFRSVPIDVTDRSSLAAALASVDVVIHFAGIMSAQSEANLEMGLQVNVVGTVNVLLECAARQTPQSRMRVIYASSVAACSCDADHAEGDAPVYYMARSSYGTHKAIGEMLISDLSRRGCIDGMTLRFPTITVRAGVPSGAASSFVSDIVREPLHGRRANCPVELGTRLSICSPATAVKSCILAMGLDTSQLPRDRVVVVPGLTVTVEEMLATVAKHADTAALVSHEHSDTVARIVGGWPAVLDSALARQLGFAPDADFDSIVQEYIDTHFKT